MVPQIFLRLARVHVVPARQPSGIRSFVKALPSIADVHFAKKIGHAQLETDVDCL